MRSRELTEKVGIGEQNLSLLKGGKVKGVRFLTLEAICRHLHCQSGQPLEYLPSAEAAAPSAARGDGGDLSR
jgi:putative transcriptional regulator